MNVEANWPIDGATMVSGAFDAAVIVCIDGETIFVDDAKSARSCLLEQFPDPEGASFKRALTACDVCLATGTSGNAARATFVVAAMEAGYAFEVIEDPLAALERRTEIEAEAGLRSILSEKAMLI